MTRSRTILATLVQIVVVEIMSAAFGFLIGSVQCVIGTNAWTDPYIAVPMMEGGIAGVFLGLLAGPLIYFGFLKGHVGPKDWISIAGVTAVIGWASAYIIYKTLGKEAVLGSNFVSIIGLGIAVFARTISRGDVSA